MNKINVTHLTGKLTIVGFFSRINVVLLNLCFNTPFHVLMLNYQQKKQFQYWEQNYKY